MAVASGMQDYVIAAGAEKMTDLDDSLISSVLDSTSDADWEASMGITFASLYVMIARRIIHDKIATREDIASVSVNSHIHGEIHMHSIEGL